MFIYFSAFLFPSYFFSSLSSVLVNAVSFVAVMYLVFKQYKPSKLVLCLACIFFVLIISTFYNSNSISFSLIMEQARLLVFAAFVEYCFTKKLNDALSVLCFVITLYVIIDAFSVVLLPNGIIQKEMVWNQWSTSYEPIWFFGRKNNRVFYYIVSIFLLLWKYQNNPNSKGKIKLLLMMALTIIISFLERSSTSIVVSIVLAVFLCIYLFHLFPVKKPKISIFLIIYVIAAVVIVWGSSSFLQFFVEGFLGKDMTFSSRTIIWSQMIQYYSQKPILGWGVIGSDTTSDMLGSIDFTSAHNQWLQFLFQGGIILFVFAIIFNYIIWKRIAHQGKPANVYLMTAFMSAIYIECLFEAQFNTVKLLLLYFIIYLYAIHNNLGGGKKSE